MIHRHLVENVNATIVTAACGASVNTMTPGAYTTDPSGTDCPMCSQTVTTSWPAQDEKVAEFRTTIRNVKPSWKLYGKGSAELRVAAPIDGSWVDVAVSEHSFGDKPDSRVTTKDTRVLLTPSSGRALYEFLRSIYGNNGETIVAAEAVAP